MNKGELVLDGEPEKIFQFEDELEKIGLGVPQSTKVIHSLNKLGADIKGEYMTAESAAEAIYRWLS